MTSGSQQLVYLVSLVVLLTVVVYTSIEFDEVLFNPVTIDSIVGLLTPLFVIALFLERTQEVFISTWRKIGRDELESGKARTKQDLSAAENQLTTLQQANAAPGDLQEAQSQVDILGAQLVDKENEITLYKGETRRTAFLVGITAGILVSVVGVRVLHPLMDADFELAGLQDVAFDSLDIFITGGLLGGGSDGIHKGVSVITDFLDATRDKMKP